MSGPGDADHDPGRRGQVQAEAAVVLRGQAAPLGVDSEALLEPGDRLLVAPAARRQFLVVGADLLHQLQRGVGVVRRQAADGQVRQPVEVQVGQQVVVFAAAQLGVDLRLALDAKQLTFSGSASLSGLTVAAYYGCQCLRPYVEFDDPERPVSMEPFIEATGASVLDWEMGSRCCGASLVSTQPEVGLERVCAILKAAAGADLIVTVCPMCQINLDGWQAKASRIAGEDLSITVLYLPQLIGLSLGLSSRELGLDLNLAIEEGFWDKIGI